MLRNSKLHKSSPVMMTDVMGNQELLQRFKSYARRWHLFSKYVRAAKHEI